jgi:hypothetical protein
MSVNPGIGDSIRKEQHHYQSAPPLITASISAMLASESMSDTGEGTGQYRVSVTWPSRR